MRRTIAVIGGGAAGLMAAGFAAEEAGPGVEVHLFESTPDGGRKILISGGGRCNVLPGVARYDDYVTDSSRNSLKRILRGWPLDEQVDFFTHELGIALKVEPETGKRFPVSNKARDVRDALVERARGAGVVSHFSCRVTGVRPAAATSRSDVAAALSEAAGRWIVEFADRAAFEADRVIVATGGLSVPKTGSEGAGLRWAEALGHTVRTPYPALTPLTSNPHDWSDLAGVSLEVTLRASGARPAFSAHGGFLVTHRGFSGPTVLNASHLAIRSRDEASPPRLEVQWSDWDRAQWDHELVAAGSGSVGGMVGSRLPQRLARRLVEESGVPWDRSLARLTRTERAQLATRLGAWPLPWNGDEGYHKAEVTGGGVALEEVDPLTLESRVRPGLHLCGEVLDAFGPIGGHNFVWAWATGRGAGQGAARALRSDG